MWYNQYQRIVVQADILNRQEVRNERCLEDHRNYSSDHEDFAQCELLFGQRISHHGGNQQT